MFFGFVTVAAVTSLVGIISEGFSALFVRMSTEANKRVDTSREEQYKTASIRLLLNSIADMKMKGITLNDSTVKTITSYMFGLSTNGDSDESQNLNNLSMNYIPLAMVKEKSKSLKTLHNSFNDLEYAIDPIKEYISMNINKKRNP